MKTIESGQVLHVHLDRGPKLNAMDRAAWQGLKEAVREADDSPLIRAVVIHGDARAFSAGNDINAMAEAGRKEIAEEYFLDGMLPTFEAMARSRVPIISVAEGIAFGGGLEILCFSDLVVATPQASFSLPETRIGVWATIYLGACASTSSRRAGATLALTGTVLNGAEALRLGIVTHLCPRDELEEVLRGLLAGITAAKPDATARTKAWLNRDLIHVGLPRCREALKELCEETMHQREYDEALAQYFSARRAAKTGPEAAAR